MSLLVYKYNLATVTVSPMFMLFTFSFILRWQLSSEFHRSVG